MRKIHSHERKARSIQGTHESPKTSLFSPKNPGEGFFSEAEWQALGEALRLSPRELQVAQLIFLDIKRTAIARRLGCTESTICTYTRRLFSKLRVASQGAMILRLMWVSRVVG